MPLFDYPLDELRSYLPERNEPVDFDKFWNQTLAVTRQYPLQPEFNRADFGLRTLDVYDVSFNGYQGQTVKGWLLLPRHIASDSPLACVVEFIGYGGGRSFPYDWLTWSSCGFAHFIMDTRGQGSDKRHGDTPDIETEPGAPQAPGFLTRGVTSPRTYYYRRVFTDAIRAVEAARSFSQVNANRIAVTGRSQGGGISLAVAGLDQTIGVVMPDVPFLCHFQRAVEITDEGPYLEIIDYCKTQRYINEKVFETLGYFDGMNFAVRARAKSLFSVALMDKTCPPSTVFAAYNHYAGEKDIRVWKYNDHEGGEAFQVREKIKFLTTVWE